MHPKPPFSAGVASIGALLGGRTSLAVPSYQRSYAWTRDKAAQLLDDLQAAIDDTAEGRSSDYFLGAVVLMETSKLTVLPSGQSTASMEIVDGLQRLATLTILFAVLRDIAEADDPEAAMLAQACIADLAADPIEPRLRLTLPLEIQDFFYDFVQEPRATSAMPDDDDLRPVEARLLEVREYLMAEVIEESPGRRRALLDFLLDRCHVAVITSNTLDRAHQIFSVLNNRGQPLARGDILKAELAGQISAERRPVLHEAWTEAERQLGGSLDDLFSHLRFIEGRSRSRIIDDMRDIVARSGSVDEFLATTFRPYVRILVSINAALAGEPVLDPRIRRAIVYLGWLGSSDWIPPLMLYWRLVDGDPQRLAEFLAKLDRLAYGFKLLGLGGDKRSARYKAVVEAVKSGELNSGGGPIELTREEKRLILFNLRAIHARNQLACRLVLFRLNDLISERPQLLDISSLTVEHVLPQKPTKGSQWCDWFTASERERYTQSLGNLILVPREQNELARNLELSRKLEIYFSHDSRLPPISRMIEGLTEWRAGDIAAREQRFLEMLNDLWHFAPDRILTPSTSVPSPLRPVQPKPIRRKGSAAP
ncbi:MAG: DUF262 domain-containing protein [Proteobacteria bacterium]|nr:DUF262 domain-containing protein [Pseudomonadota bacterium]